MRSDLELLSCWMISALASVLAVPNQVISLK